jgi:hypothetical protein
MRPPRALWVPFPLGRPLGPPGLPELQSRVLVAALQLLEAPSVPVLADWPEDAPEDDADGHAPLACPVPPAAPGTDGLRAALAAEVAFLRPWYDLGAARRGRTTVGISGLDAAEAVALVADFVEGGAVDPARLKLAADDVRAYYLEAASAQPGAAALESWFWHETAAGSAMRELREAALAADDPALQLIGKVLVLPVGQR